MKILTNKKVDELLRKITACQIIAFGFVEDNVAYEKITENLADMAFEIGGEKGGVKVQNSVDKYMDKWGIKSIPHGTTTLMFSIPPIRPPKH